MKHVHTYISASYAHFHGKKRFKLADKIYVTYTNLLLLKSRHGVNVAAQ